MAISLSDVSNLTGKGLVSALKTASLTDEEIQKLIDVLLNRQQSSDQWTKVSLLVTIAATTKL